MTRSLSERAFSDRLLIVVSKGKFKNVYVFYLVDVIDRTCRISVGQFLKL